MQMLQKEALGARVEFVVKTIAYWVGQPQPPTKLKPLNHNNWGSWEAKSEHRNASLGTK